MSMKVIRWKAISAGTGHIFIFGDGLKLGCNRGGGGGEGGGVMWGISLIKNGRLIFAFKKKVSSLASVAS